MSGLRVRGGAPPPPNAPPWPAESAARDTFISFIVLTAMSTAGRIFSKIGILRDASWDDLLMVLGWAVQTIGLAVNLKWLPYSHGADTTRLSPINVLEMGYWAHFNIITYSVSLGLVKTSICIQILRIFAPNRGRNFWAIWTFTGIQGAFFFAVFWATVFQCIPVSYWYDKTEPGRCRVNGIDVNLVITILNLCFDTIMWTYPLVRTAQLNLPLRKKLKASVVFSIGLVAILSSITRLVIAVLDYKMRTFQTSRIFPALDIVSCIIAANCVYLPPLATEVNKHIRRLANCLWRKPADAMEQKAEPSDTQSSIHDSARSDTRLGTEAQLDSCA